jgi:hypothetical protein
MNTLLRNQLYIFPGILLCVILYCAVNLYQTESKRRQLKEDLIELSKVKYGLFNVDEWKKVLSDIITKKVEEFNFRGSSREAMRKNISNLLYKVIGDFEQRYEEQNSRSIKGLIRGEVASFLGIFSNAKRDVPKFTEQILDFMNDPKNRKAVKRYIVGKLNEYANKTFSKTDYTYHDQLIARYQQKDRKATITHLTTQIEELDRNNQLFKGGLLFSAAICALFLLMSRNVLAIEYLLFTLISVVLLLLGLLIPMIEIDARISSMTFQLLGEPVSFQDQVLYYKSKSILEVVGLMVNQGRSDLLFVGFLVFAFSVLFPISKLVATVVYLFTERFRNNVLIRFMIFKTGKWSMADVMVIAIFMSYIGFSGIITEQLKQIEHIATNMEILTTNKSSLLAGFFSFTSFAILSLLISHKLQYEKMLNRKTDLNE